MWGGTGVHFLLQLLYEFPQLLEEHGGRINGQLRHAPLFKGNDGFKGVLTGSAIAYQRG